MWSPAAPCWRLAKVCGGSASPPSSPDSWWLLVWNIMEERAGSPVLAPLYKNRMPPNNITVCVYIHVCVYLFIYVYTYYNIITLPNNTFSLGILFNDFLPYSRQQGLKSGLQLDSIALNTAARSLLRRLS